MADSYTNADFMTRLTRMFNPAKRDETLRPFTNRELLQRAYPRQGLLEALSPLGDALMGKTENLGISEIKPLSGKPKTYGGQLAQGLGNLGLLTGEAARRTGEVIGETPFALSRALGTESEYGYADRIAGLEDILSDQSRMQQGQLSSVSSSPSVLSSQSIVGGPSYQQTGVDADQDAAIRSQIADAQAITEEDGIFGDFREPGVGIPDFVGGVPAAQAEEAQRKSAAEVDEGDSLIEMQATVDDGGEADAALGASKAKSGAVTGADTPVKQSTVAALDEVLKQVRPDAKPKDYDDYMKEFADLTGLDVSGQPDNSQALMAFGLALMQNKAGKGFNVGEMLSSVGAAGEKAMPALAAARKEAKTTRIKAAEFAISRKDKDRAEALNKQFYYVVPKGGKGFAANFDRGELKRFNSQDLYDLDSNEDFQNNYEIIPMSTYEKVAEAALKTPELGDKYSKSYAPVSLFTDAPKDFQIEVQRVDGNYKGSDMPERGRFNVGEYETYAARLQKMDQGLDKFANKIGEAYNLVQSDQVTTLDQIGDAATDLGNALGLKLTSEMSPSAKVKRILNVIAAEKAPEILGEAGKTISDRDRERVTQIAGELTLTTPPATLKRALQEMYERVVVKGKTNVRTGITTLNQYSGVKSDARTAKMVNGVLVVQ
jgi:hypothetical protein